jgi:hypothetical protein
MPGGGQEAAPVIPAPPYSSNAYDSKRAYPLIAEQVLYPKRSLLVSGTVDSYLANFASMGAACVERRFIMLLPQTPGFVQCSARVATCNGPFTLPEGIKLPPDQQDLLQFGVPPPPAVGCC